jgi:hypothetical protein
MHPNAREKASFLKENLLPMQQAGALQLISEDGPWMPNISLKFVHGHTDGMLIPHISCNGKTVVFMADLLPSAAHIPLPWVMAYDTRPLVSMDEKEAFLVEAANNDYILFFEHDPVIECCTVEMTERGVKVKETMTLKEALAR